MGLSTLKGNSGYIGIDKRSSVTGTTIGNISLKKLYLERVGGNLVPIIPPGPSTILFEDDFSGNNLNKWTVENGAQSSGGTVTITSDSNTVNIESSTSGGNTVNSATKAFNWFMTIT